MAFFYVYIRGDLWTEPSRFEMSRDDRVYAGHRATERGAWELVAKDLGRTPHGGYADGNVIKIGSSRDPEAWIEKDHQKPSPNRKRGDPVA